ncbi:MAG: aromatic amino acid lyase, partial [Chitinophagaceae bacterium]
MSYNYLPLDHKWLHIEQIENLLAYQQLLSITFTAHEQITSNSFHENEEKITEILNYIDIKEQLNSSKNVSVQQLNEDVIQLMIAFKIKSLSYGKSGVSIETVKQLLHIYNHQIIPIIPPFHKSENIHALSSLCRMMNNNQQVYFSQRLIPINTAFAETGFISKVLNKQEILAISTGNQYTTACSYFTIQKAKKIIALFTHAFANCVQIVGYKKEHWQKSNFYNKKIDS